MSLNNQVSLKIAFAVFTTVVLPILGGKILSTYYPIHFINLPLHASLEIAGGMIAIIIATIFYIKNYAEKLFTHFNWAATALLAMGVIDIFHGIMMPGELFVWLHSTAVFFGGIFFISVWFKEKVTSEAFYRYVPLSFLAFSIMFSVGSIVLVDYLPAMLNEDKSFTIWANVLNVLGGVGFFLAALKFIILYRQSYNNDELLFAGHAMLFGIAGVLFVNSTIWDMQWWLWHFLRLFAYIIALYFLYKEFKSEIHAVELKNKKLDLANKKIASYLGLIDRYVITSTTDVHGKIIDASQAFCEISGYNIYELIGKSHSIVRAPDVSQNFYKQMWDQLQKDQIWSGEIKNQKKDGSTYWVHATISPIYDENGSKIGYTAIRQDITDKKIIEEISITDSLTKIYNRRHFDDFIPNLINSAKRKNVLFAFVMFDIDYFKYYNDTYGHKMGDNTLVEIGRISKEILRRADDYCFRLGGEEFGAVFIVDHKDQALEIANSIKEKIEELHIEHKKNKVSKYVTASFGLVCKRALEIDSLDQLYQEADKLLYEAKSLGRNKVVLNP